MSSGTSGRPLPAMRFRPSSQARLALRGEALRFSLAGPDEEARRPVLTFGGPTNALRSGIEPPPRNAASLSRRQGGARVHSIDDNAIRPSFSTPLLPNDVIAPGWRSTFVSRSTREFCGEQRTGSLRSRLFLRPPPGLGHAARLDDGSIKSASSTSVFCVAKTNCCAMRLTLTCHAVSLVYHIQGATDGSVAARGFRSKTGRTETGPVQSINAASGRQY